MDRSLAQVIHEVLSTEIPIVTMPKDVILQALDREASRQFISAHRFMLTGLLFLIYTPGLDNMIQNPPATPMQWIPRLFPLVVFVGILCWNGLSRKDIAMPIKRRIREALLIRAFARIIWVGVGIFATIFLLRRVGWWKGWNLSDLPDAPLGIALAFTIPALALVLYAGSRKLARRLDPYWFA